MPVNRRRISRPQNRVDFLLTVSPYKDGTDPIVQETITVYPNGAEAYQPVAFTPDADDAVLVDSSDIDFEQTFALLCEIVIEHLAAAPEAKG